MYRPRCRGDLDWKTRIELGDGSDCCCDLCIVWGPRVGGTRDHRMVGTKALTDAPQSSQSLCSTTQQLQCLSGSDHGALGLRLLGTPPTDSILTGWIIAAGGKESRCSLVRGPALLRRCWRASSTRRPIQTRPLWTLATDAAYSRTIRGRHRRSV
jgi:hypothetical protein